ncbi:Type II restriction/modification system, DNA methylase subunit YeeA [Candidatus Methanophagaceae archaeon]|nr:Type II restriction/modification system, DNA methylase subunit YeeA [Methanophagales archaeon]
MHKEQLGYGDSVDPEILGYIFERAMTATDRKGTGAYYTPKSITKYISENTIYPCIIEKANEILKTEKGYKDAELIKEIDELFILPATTLKQIWEKIILKLRVLDNACGSGAFLLAAANILFALNKKINDKIGAENPDTTLKILILVNNLYGVDLNPNGIEIAKLRLWLWLADSYEPGYIKPLPNIDYNLRVGNSLIGYVDLSKFKSARLTLSDFLRDEEKPTLDSLLKERNDLIHEYKISWGEEAKELKSSVQELDVKISNLLNADLYRKFREKKIEISSEEFLKLNPFHWGFEFYEVFELDKPPEERGFDVVIGNPPYVRQEALSEMKTYFQKYYKVYQGTADLYVYFIERSFSILTDGGVFSYIVANKWMRANYGKQIRKWLKQQRIEEILDFGDLPVFQVTTYPCIIRISKNTPELEFNVTQVQTLKFTSLDDYVKANKYVVKQGGLEDSGWSLADDKTLGLLDKIRHVGRPLGEYVDGKIYRGVLTGFNKAFVIDADTREKLIAEDAKSEELIKPFLVGRDIKRYQPLESERYLIFTRRGIEIQQYPAIERYLLQFKERLMPKPKDWKGEKWQGRKPGAYEWYEIQDTVNYYTEFEKPKIIYPNICKKPEFTFDEDGWYTNQKCFIISKPDRYLLGILNSSLTFFLFISILPLLRGDFYEPSYVYVKEFPIRTIDFMDHTDKLRHDRMVELVDRMLEFQEQLVKTTTETDKAMLRRQIDATDQEIDNLVYELYELTPEEIAIVERSSK